MLLYLNMVTVIPPPPRQVTFGCSALLAILTWKVPVGVQIRYISQLLLGLLQPAPPPLLSPITHTGMYHYTITVPYHPSDSSNVSNPQTL